jgi:hypothetical protein
MTDEAAYEGKIACAYCKRSIPASEAVQPEAHDYVLYFCGGECHAHWERQRAQGVEEACGRRSGVKPS